MPGFRVLLSLIACAAIGIPAIADSPTVVILFSEEQLGNQEITKGLHEECSIEPQPFVLSTHAGGPEAVVKAIEGLNPAVLVVVGEPAAGLADTRLSAQPTVFVQANPGLTRTTGVSRGELPRQLLYFVGEVVSQKPTVAFAFDPDSIRVELARLRSAATEGDCSIMEVPVPNSMELRPALMRALTEKPDVIWLDDSVVVDETALQGAMRLARARGLAVIGQHPELLELGALFTLTVHQEGLGRQSGELVRAMLEGTPVDELGMKRPFVSFGINLRAATRLGFVLLGSTVDLADIVIEVE